MLIAASHIGRSPLDREGGHGLESSAAKAELEQIDLAITGMHCAACATRIEKVVKRVPGVEDARVNLATEHAVVLGHFSGADALPAILSAVQKAGYGAEPVDRTVRASSSRQVRTENTDANELWLALVLTIPLVLEMTAMLFGYSFMPVWTEWILATPVQFYIGRRFYQGAWSALRTRHATMDLLVTISSTVAYFYSVVSFASGHTDVYFDCSATVITTIVIGKYLEGRGKRASVQAMEALLQRSVPTARLLSDSGVREVSVDDLSVGNIVAVAVGETVPQDGQIIEGVSTVDESFLTGETTPLQKRPGDPVIGGALNYEAPILVRITRTGSATALAQMIRIVEEAQGSKASVQRLVDTISTLFVPTVLLASLATYLYQGVSAGWPHAWLPAISVLVAACPCALGLATPTAIMVGTGVAASRGILVRSTECLERALDIDTVVLDKTGTLTEGKMTVTDFWTIPGVRSNTVLAAAARLESSVSHPIAVAIQKFARQQGVSFSNETNAENLVGQGVIGVVDGKSVRIGRAEWAIHRLYERGVQEHVEAWEREGKSVVVVVRDGIPVGVMALYDPLKPDAVTAVRLLRRLGLEVHLVSGDNGTACQNIAQQVGIEHITADARPDDKVRLIQSLKESGRVVAMVGDGINDAPALATAHLGIALGTGAELALQTADITIVQGQPTKILESLDIARKMRRKIRQNLFGSLLYNLIIIPFAALGFFNPMLAGAAMALSSVTVVLNSLLLRRIRFAVYR